MKGENGPKDEVHKQKSVEVEFKFHRLHRQSSSSIYSFFVSQKKFCQAKSGGAIAPPKFLDSSTVKPRNSGLQKSGSLRNSGQPLNELNDLFY